MKTIPSLIGVFLLSTPSFAFDITVGHARGVGTHSNGGAFYLDNASLLIADCIIQGNKAVESGGGVSCINYSPPRDLSLHDSI